MLFLEFESLETRRVLSSDPLVILPLGDSIVQGEYHAHSEVRRNFGYRAALQELLIEDEIEFDFVGTRSNRCREASEPQMPFAGFDPDHEGHWGWTSQEIMTGRAGHTCGQLVEGALPDWLASYEAEPDFVLLHLGLNDVIQSLPSDYSATTNDLTDEAIASIGRNIQRIVEELLMSIDNPDVAVLVAKLNPGSVIRNEVEAVNAWLEDTMSTNGNVALVDHFTGFDPVLMTYDGLHPNELGQEFMARRWFDAIQASSSVGLSSPSSVVGDFNADDLLGVADIEMLQCLILDHEAGQQFDEPSSISVFDLTEDGQIDLADLNQLVEIEVGTRRGDADLDGVVDFDDFLVVSRNYGQVGKWSTGDFDSDGVIGFLDFLHVARNYNF